jgi:hypothetical protein
MQENQADPPERNILDGTNFRQDATLVVVTQACFQSNANGIDKTKVAEDVLGFCSFVLSYAKAARNELAPDQSPKLFSVFMPRTEFNTIYG